MKKHHKIHSEQHQQQLSHTKSQRLSKKFRPPTPPYFNIRQEKFIHNKDNKMKSSSPTTQRLPPFSFFSAPANDSSIESQHVLTMLPQQNFSSKNFPSWNYIEVSEIKEEGTRKEY